MRCFIFMKIGPHSGMNLEDIVKSKINEESIHGVSFWGYSGNFCHPNLVHSFTNYSLQKIGKPPKLALIETSSCYFSNIGFVNEYSSNNKDYYKLPHPIQLQNCRYSFVTKSTKKVSFLFDMNKFRVFGGSKHGIHLNEYFKYRINKVCATSESPIELQVSKGAQDTIKISYISDLADPYCIWVK